jgi:hypothetical protein
MTYTTPLPVRCERAQERNDAQDIAHADLIAAIAKAEGAPVNVR